MRVKNLVLILSGADICIAGQCRLVQKSSSSLVDVQSSTEPSISDALPTFTTPVFTMETPIKEGSTSEPSNTEPSATESSTTTTIVPVVESVSTPKPVTPVASTTSEATPIATTTAIDVESVSTDLVSPTTEAATLVLPTTSVAAPPATTNRFVNSGFEDSVSDLSPWAVTENPPRSPTSSDRNIVVASQEGAHSGNNYNFLSTSQLGSVFTYCQTVQVELGYEYTISSWLRISCSSGPFDGCFSNDYAAVYYTLGEMSNLPAEIPPDAPYAQFDHKFQYEGTQTTTDACMVLSVTTKEFYSIIFMIDDLSFTLTL